MVMIRVQVVAAVAAVTAIHFNREGMSTNNNQIHQRQIPPPLVPLFLPLVKIHRCTMT